MLWHFIILVSMAFSDSGDASQIVHTKIVAVINKMLTRFYQMLPDFTSIQFVCWGATECNEDMVTSKWEWPILLTEQKPKRGASVNEISFNCHIFFTSEKLVLCLESKSCFQKKGDMPFFLKHRCDLTLG